ncbi:MAG: helix-turn-helix transcriptional regulator [Alphaproteobacteria bacterium]|nr:helix-turn-helix transcriptional regulator [Alphaproteobacteria bacterium]MBF0249873.1 helix-turn-helix transcriptional regulator [Alphaproteobacteria bacterium]
MLKHGDVWKAVDKLAAAHGLSTSGLARKAGLDPTTFNKSKRTTGEGKLRWPSTESVSKILRATGADLMEFVAYLQDGDTVPQHNIPLIGFAQAGAQGYFDDAGYPTGGGWDEIKFPGTSDDHSYALEISGDSMEPVYRDGDIVIVSPGSGVRRGDRVVVKTAGGEVMAKVLKRKTAQRVELSSFNPAHADREIPTSEVEWVARIVWAAQ